MERHEVLAMMTALKLAGMRAAADDILATWTPRGGAQASSSGAADHRYAAAGRDRRQDGALDQVPDGVRQVANGQGAGRLRLRRLASQRAPDPGARRRRLPGGQAQHRAGRRHRHRQDPSRRRHRALLHPQGRPGPLLQRRRPGQPPRGRAPRRTPGPHRGPARTPRLRHPRRTRLPALRPGRRAAALPPHEPAPRAHLYRHHHHPRLRRMAIRLRRPQDDHRAARPSHPSLRDHRDRQRELALQEPLPSRRRPCPRPGCPGGSTGTPRGNRDNLRRAAQGGQFCTPIGGQY